MNEDDKEQKKEKKDKRNLTRIKRRRARIITEGMKKKKSVLKTVMKSITKRKTKGEGKKTKTFRIVRQIRNIIVRRR